MSNSPTQKKTAQGECKHTPPGFSKLDCVGGADPFFDGFLRSTHIFAEDSVGNCSYNFSHYETSAFALVFHFIFRETPVVMEHFPPCC